MFEMMRLRFVMAWFGMRYALAMAAMVLFLLLGVMGFFTSPFPLNVLLLVPYCFLSDIAWERHKKARREFELRQSDLAHESEQRTVSRKATDDTARAVFARCMREYQEEQQEGRAA